ncbi:MAG TPA: hypothetical protein VLD57_02555 [Blastocatellia bacterium]|nr:hypothetical protein [Blastocatellia bacterium]
MRSTLQKRTDPLQIILLIVLIAALAGTAYYFDVAGFGGLIKQYVLGEAQEKETPKGAEKGKTKDTDKGKPKEPEKPEKK